MYDLPDDDPDFVKGYIVTLGESLWRDLDFPYRPGYGLSFRDSGRNSAFCDGAFHWIVNNHDEHAVEHILAMDLDDEKFHTLQLPDSFLENKEPYYYGLATLGASLVLIGSNRYCRSIWKLMDRKKRLWTHEYKYDMSSLKNSWRSYCGYEIIDLIDEDSLLVVINEDKTMDFEEQQSDIVVYRPKKKQCCSESGVAEKLVEQAMKEAAMMKDITHSTLTRVPIGKRALYHDDIAAIVVFTEHKLIREPKSVPEISVCVRMEDDRISDLPPELHKHILSLLSTKQVLQTCVLSKTWKDVWRTTLTSIIVDQRDFEDLSKLEDFGNSLLDSMPYDFNIQRFRVSCWDSSPPIPSSSVEDYDDRFLFLNMWILVVIHGTVQHIDLQVNNVPRGFKLNGHIFSSQHLKVLELSMNTYINFTCPISLPLLQSLHLGRIQFYDEDKIESLFSSCPILHSLSLIDCQFSSLKLLKISARHLRNLTIVGQIYEVATMISTPELMSLKFHSWDKLQMGRISFKDALVLLVEADICLRDSSEISIWFLKLVQNVRCLTLSFHFLESFKGEETNRAMYMRHPLQNLRILVLETSYSDTHVALVKTLVTYSKVESLVLKNY